MLGMTTGKEASELPTKGRGQDGQALQRSLKTNT
jgi:hypothetical protein